MAPRHVSLIMDGNRRNGEQNRLSKLITYRSGANNGRRIAERLFKHGATEVSAWSGSGSNFIGRPKDIPTLFAILKEEMRKRLHRREEVAFKLCGAWREYTSDRTFHGMVDMLEEKTAKYAQERRVTILFGYDGGWDIEQAVQSLHSKGIPPTLDLIRQNLWTAHLPDADMIIRTGMEGDHSHDSDPYLPLQRKGAFLYNTKTLWPQFDEAELEHALACFAAYKPRHGT